jgi:lipid A 3-O-deacylase
MRGNTRGRVQWVAVCALLLWAGFYGGAGEALQPAAPSLWEGGVGDGFAKGVETVTIEAGANYGLANFGSRESHDFALLSLSYGRMLGAPAGGDHWHRGNWELRGEVFGGTQFSPEDDWLFGLTPHLRYNFATGTRWVPFVDGGVGVMLTSIRLPDLSNIFEFNAQGGMGIHWFASENFVLTMEVRYIHISCAGISHPNYGVNGVMGLIGVSRFF